MSLKIYTIKNAITNCGYGPKIDYAEAYDDYIEFSASSDEEALKIAEKLQSEHDKKYNEICDNERDYDNAPSYEHNLFQNERKLEF